MTPTPYYQTAWFWIVIIGIILIIIGVVVYALYRTAYWYVWALLIVGILMVIGGAIYGGFSSKPTTAVVQKQVVSTPTASVPVVVNSPVCPIPTTPAINPCVMSTAEMVVAQRI